MIRYRVDLSHRLQHLVRVTVQVPAELAAGARLVLPVWTPGSYVVRDYVRHLQRIDAQDHDGEAIALTPDGGSAWRLAEDARGPVDVTLELYANDLTVRTNHVDDHHALLVAAATLPHVEGAEDRPHEVHLAPSRPGERVWSLLPPGEAPDTFVAEDRDHLVDSAFEVGDLPHLDVEVAGIPHTFVWAGHGGRPDLTRVGADTAAIAAAAADVFGGELPIDRYTVLVVGWDVGQGGLEHRDGMVLQMPTGMFQDDDLYARFQSLVAHEYLHLWNVKRLVPAALVRPRYDRPTRTESLWVAEGWTAYYDDLLPFRAGLWSQQRFLDVLSTVWQRTRETPGTAVQSLRQASYDAWTKHYRRDENAVNAMTDYYGHGALVAWELDLRLRLREPDGDGLDGVLRLMWDRHAGIPAGYTEDDVLAAVAECGGDELAALVDERVGRPGLPDLDEVVEVVGLRWDDDGPGIPVLGVRAEDDGGRGVRIAAVLRDQPAWRAGITGGDRLAAIDGQTVRAGGLETALRRYDPGNDVEVTVVRGPRLLHLEVTLGDPVPQPNLRAADDPSDAQRDAFQRWAHRPLETR